MFSDQGKRNSMEDVSIVHTFPDRREWSVLGVWDGHGGSDASRDASHLLVAMYDVVMQSRGGIATTVKQMEQSLVNAHDWTRQKLAAPDKRKHYEDQGTTSCTCLLSVQRRQLWCCNVGDSRAILCDFKRKQAIPLSIDHKPSEAFEAGRLKRLGATVYAEEKGDPERIWVGKNGLSVSRSFGDHNMFPYVSCEPDITFVKLPSKKQFHNAQRFALVIGCDGVWDVLSTQDVYDLLATSEFRTNTATGGNRRNESLARLVGTTALERGSTDNISVVVSLFD